MRGLRVTPTPPGRQVAAQEGLLAPLQLGQRAAHELVVLPVAEAAKAEVDMRVVVTVEYQHLRLKLELQGA